MTDTLTADDELAATEENDDETTEAAPPDEQTGRRKPNWLRIVGFGILPTAVLLLAIAAGYLNWLDGSARQSTQARIESVQAATESTVAMLSYRPDSVDQGLKAAGERLTGPFKDSYAQLINDVVIPGAKQKGISAVATVPAAAVVSATATHAVVVVFVNQTTIIGTEAPTNTASSVRVTLEKVDSQWLVSDFTPV
ncbi:hypothetical protein ACPCIR_30500 [Mycobacterium sp. NPDC051198]